MLLYNVQYLKARVIVRYFHKQDYGDQHKNHSHLNDSHTFKNFPLLENSESNGIFR